MSTATHGPGARLRAARIAAGMGQEDLGRQLGVSRARVCDLEMGRRPVSLETLYDAARALGVPPSSLDPRLTDRPQ